jgi:hypothetical protein
MSVFPDVWRLGGVLKAVRGAFSGRWSQHVQRDGSHSPGANCPSHELYPGRLKSQLTK